MSRKCGKELDKGIFWKSELNVPSSPSTAELKSLNRLDDFSIISDWSQADDDYLESDVGQLMYALFRKQLYTDVIFQPKIGEESLSAHRAVLAAKCQFFEELLFGKKAKGVQGMTMTVEIDNLPFNIFKKIVEYFYTDEIDFEDVGTMLDIFSGANHFQVQSLVERCESYIESLELTEDNVCFIFQMCSGVDIKQLRNRCLSYIQRNTGKVISSETFQKCIYNTVYVICNLAALSLDSEEQLIDAVAEWIHVQSSHIKWQLITPLLSCIRFLTFSAPELGSIIQKHPDIMTAEDALKIMIFLNSSKETKNLVNLPTWCNTNTQRRCFKQNNMETALKGNAPIPEGRGIILISLKPSDEPQKISEQSSLLQIKCIKGSHQINAIKLSFQGLPPNESISIVISVKVAHQRIFLDFRKCIVTLSKEKLFEFVNGVRISEGRVANIEVIARSAKPFNLFQLDKNQYSLQNEHFHCCLTSEPADKKQFIVSEMQYGPPQEVKYRQGTFKKNRCLFVHAF